MAECIKLNVECAAAEFVTEDNAILYFCVFVDQSAAAAVGGAGGTGFGKRERQNIDPGKH